jgi:AraC family transcriptional regulator
VFRGVVGEPVKAHVRRLRLERAARDLRCQGAPRSITELAFDAGYETPEAFTKAFRQRFGQSPSEFRTSETGPYTEVGPLFERLMGWAGPAGVFGPMTRVFGRFWDDPEVTPADKLRSEVCISVTGSPEVPGGISLATQPAGRFVKHVHTGSYETLGETYGQLIGQWIPALDVTLAEGAPCVEIYLNSPADTAPEDLRTEIYVPLA